MRNSEKSNHTPFFPLLWERRGFKLDKRLKFAFNTTGLINAWKIDNVLTPESDWKSHESCPKFHPGAGKDKSAETFREKVKSCLFDELVM